jgi:RNA polymerase sigma-70 factor (family 1)
MGEYKSYTDKQLTEMLKHGDRLAYAEIYNRYKRLLYLFAFKRLGQKEEVWDMVHEVFLSLWLHHETLEISYTLSTYLHSAVRNKIANVIAHKQVSTRYLDSFKNFLEVRTNNTDHLVRHKELEAIIEKEIAALPEKMRLVFELSRKTNYTRKEIATELGLSEETVKSHMHQALKKLKIKLSSLFGTVFLLALFFAVAICRSQSPELKNIRTSLTKITDSTRYIDALNRMAMLLYEKNIDSTFYYTKQAREIADRIQYKKGRVDALNNLGVFFDIKGNLQLALRYYNEAYAGYTTLKDSANRVQAMMNIAMVYKEIGKDGKAIQRYEAALNLGNKLSRDSIMSLAIYNYLLQYPNKFNSKLRRSYIARAKSIGLKYKDERVLLAIDQLIADDMIAHGQQAAGIALLAQTINTAIARKLYYVSMDMLIDIGDKLVISNPKQAVAYYHQGLDIAVQNGYLFYSQLMARKLFDFYIANGNYIKAAEYGRQLVLLHDEQEQINSASGIDYLDYALKDQQLRSLETQSGYQKALLMLTVLACLLAMAILLSIRKNLRRTRRQNTAMKEALGALEQSQADNTRMMKIAAHDLRNPIGGITALSSIMLSEPNRSADDKEMLEMIKKSGENSLELVSDLLQVQFKTEALNKDWIDIGEILQYCVSLLLNKAQEKNQQIILQNQSLVLYASREKLWRVISNLIANAIKFSPNGGKIEVKMLSDEQKVRIEIKDYGIGIPSEIQDRIFDMFTDAKRTGTAGEKAYGLGLAIAKQIVEAHKGKIGFVQNVDQGTTFFVELPINLQRSKLI